MLKQPPAHEQLQRLEHHIVFRKWDGSMMQLMLARDEAKDRVFLGYCQWGLHWWLLPCAGAGAQHTQPDLPSGPGCCHWLLDLVSGEFSIKKSQLAEFLQGSGDDPHASLWLSAVRFQAALHPGSTAQVASWKLISHNSLCNPTT